MEAYLQEINIAVNNYKEIQNQADRAQLLKYFQSYDNQDYQQALKFAPQELYTSVSILLQTTQQIQTLEEICNEDIIFNELQQMITFHDISQIFTDEIIEKFSKFNDKQKLFSLIKDKLMQNYIVFIQKQAFLEKLIRSFGSYSEVVENFILDQLIANDIDRKFIYQGADDFLKQFSKRYNSIIWKQQNDIIENNFRTQISYVIEELRLKKDVAPGQFIHYQNEQEKLVLELMFCQFNEQIIRDAQISVLQFLKNIEKVNIQKLEGLSLKQSFQNFLEQLKTIDYIAGSVQVQQHYNQSEQKLIELLRSISIVNPYSHNTVISFILIQSLQLQIIDQSFFNSVIQIEFKKMKKYYYSQCIDFIESFSTLINKTKANFNENQDFIISQFKQILSSFQKRIKDINHLPIDSQSKDNIIYSSITAFIEQITKTLSLNNLPNELTTTLKNLTKHEFYINKPINDNLLECLSAYKTDYRQICQTLKLDWVMVNFALHLLLE